MWTEREMQNGLLVKMTGHLNKMVSARIVGFVNLANTIPAMQAYGKSVNVMFHDFKLKYLDCCCH